jgi:hypothetical protein
MTRHGSTSTIPGLPAGGWRTASRCGPNGGNCVAVNVGTELVGVRDTKPVDGSALVFGSADWRSFLAAATEGTLHA